MLTRLMRNQTIRHAKSSMRFKNFYMTNDHRKYQSIKEPQDIKHYFE